MAQKLANIIIDISHEKVDRTFQYKIPEKLLEYVSVGTQVMIPFGAGNHLRKGYVVELTETPEYNSDKLKEITGLVSDGVSVESQLIWLAWWMKERYGSTMNQALKTVLPVKQKVKAKEKRRICLLLTADQLQKAMEEAEQKHFKARIRLLKALYKTPKIPYEWAMSQLNLSAAALKPLIEKKIITVEIMEIDRNSIKKAGETGIRIPLNSDQQKITDSFCEDYDDGKRDIYLIHGITGSGKTEVYMELIAHVLEDGKQAIVLIPEIALTYQTVIRFYRRFGDRISIINSKLSQGERYDQFERARSGAIDIMIGPRSALFTPFEHLGLIIIDEEQEGAYKSEVVPRYHGRDVAVKRAEMAHASVVLGSATPSIESYEKALSGQYRLFHLDKRAKENSRLAQVEVVDLREELKIGNKSIFSRRLQELITDRLSKKEQMILFLNRRGYANFISCRACGKALKCPHCDVALTLHNYGKLMCHYCGYTIPVPKHCPSCGSPYIATFGTGTQKTEELTKKMFPQARVLRMDLDTTSKKGGHEEILSAFAEGDADILIGTQMIVKGHDFPRVTLVGVLAADLSLYTSDYRCGERTFQLLTQAAGRAGRDDKRGDVIIQTYNPEHYSIITAANQDYPAFYSQEMAYRQMLRYPPSCSLFTIQLASKQEEALICGMTDLSEAAKSLEKSSGIQVIGPVNAPIYKVNDIYRKILYIKHENYGILVKIKNRLEEMVSSVESFKKILVQYDFS